MGGTGVVDRFLDIFSRYIDSGFGLLGGEVAFIAVDFHPELSRFFHREVSHL